MGHHELERIKYYISPMSLAIINAVSVFCKNNPILGLIPTRRQVDRHEGYVYPGLTTKTLGTDKLLENIPILRDHGGPNQGNRKDDGLASLAMDSQYFDGIHIDPFVESADFQNGLQYTLKAIKMIHSINPNTFIEVLTEEAIRHFTVEEIRAFLIDLRNNLESKNFELIRYCVIQSGVKIDLVEQVNTGNFSSDRLKKMIDLCTEFGILSKEHNGDYLGTESIRYRFENGLNSLNIGPEIAQIETKAILEELNEADVNKWYARCVESRKWERWQTDNFDINNKEQVIMVCGHYNRSNINIPTFDGKVKKQLLIKFDELYEATR